MTTVVHVTHEAVEKVGGIGTVLEGLLTAPSYRREVPRSILVGPLFGNEPAGEGRLGPEGTVIFSSLDGIDRDGLQKKLGPVCERFGVGIVYGRRRFEEVWSGSSAEVEVLLVEVGNMKPGPLREFKYHLYESFGVKSDRYEFIWDFEQYVRLAPPGIEAIRRLLGEDPEDAILVQAHEFMGVPFALGAMLSTAPRMAAAFHAHETATVRRIVETHPGHDVSFYGLMEHARYEGRYLEEVFGSQDAFFKHELVESAHHLDGVLAVGDFVRSELQFLSKEYATKPIDLVPNGIPALEISPEERGHSRGMLLDYAESLLRWRPDYVFTHVARLVTSKAFWRDLLVLDHLERTFVRTRRSAVFFVLSTEGAVRSTEEVHRMERDHAWPWGHVMGYPDLTGSEIALNDVLQDFNRRSRAIKIVFVNQFGWDPSRCGSRMPPLMTFKDLRQGADLEFGQSIYEPFGISQFEPLTFGAICVPSIVCGCVGFARQRVGGGPIQGLIVADYLSAASDSRKPEEAPEISRARREEAEASASRSVADRIAERLAGLSSAERLRAGHRAARAMSWEAVASDYYLPAIQSALRRANRR